MQVFADREVVLDLDFATAVSRLALLLRGGGLDGMSQDAYAEGLTGHTRVGPMGGIPGVSKRVEVHLLEPVPREGTMVVPLRWTATGRLGRLFPVLDADLILRCDEGDRAVLRLTGVYRPPLDGVGEELDKIVLNRVATATFRSFLARIATMLSTAPGHPLAPGR